MFMRVNAKCADRVRPPLDYFEPIRTRHATRQLPNEHIYAYTAARETETWGAPPA